MEFCEKQQLWQECKGLGCVHLAQGRCKTSSGLGTKKLTGRRSTRARGDQWARQRRLERSIFRAFSVPLMLCILIHLSLITAQAIPTLLHILTLTRAQLVRFPILTPTTTKVPHPCINHTCTMAKITALAPLHIRPRPSISFPPLIPNCQVALSLHPLKAQLTARVHLWMGHASWLY